MPSKDLSFVLLGEDRSASKAMTGAADTAEKTTGRIGQAFGKVGHIVGGEFGEVLSKAGEGLAQVGEHSGKMSTAMLVGGGAVTGLGVALQVMGSKDKQAADQLQRSVVDSGHSWESYKEDVESAIKKQEGFGHSAVDTQEALRKLTQATNDPQKALENMGLVADLAAARHVSLSDASGLVTKILGGKGSRTLAEYGIHLEKTGDKTKDAENALAALSKKIDGQASASMDNFSGFVTIAKTRLEDFGAQVGQTAGPILTVLGPAMMGFGVVMDIVRSKKEAATAAAIAEAVATDVETVATEGATVAQVGLNTAFLLSPIGIVVAGVAALAVTFGVAALATQTATEATASYADALKADNGVVGENVRAQAAKVLVESGVMKSAQAMGVSATDLTNAALGNVDATKAVAAALDRQKDKLEESITAQQRHARYGLILTDAQKEQKAKIGEVEKAFSAQTEEIKKNLDQQGEVKDALPQVATAAEKTAAALGMTTDAYTAVTDAQKLATESAKLWKDELDIVNGGAQSVEQTNINLASNYASTTKTITDNIKAMGRAAATSLDINTAGGLANHQIILKAVKDAQDHSAAIVTAEGGTAKAREDGRLALENQRDTIKKHMTDLGLDAGAVDALVSSELKIPPAVSTVVIVDTGDAERQIAKVRHLLDDAPSWAQTSVGVDLSARNPFFSGQPNIKRNALGGVATRPTMAIIGEAGPEAIVPLSAGHGINLGGGGGGNTTVNVTVQGSYAGDQNALAKLVLTAVTNAARQGAIPRNAFRTV